jgi:hypothetical protein
VTSPRKIAANRKNARRSTGPRTTPGKLLARGNALKHGLATAVRGDPTLVSEIERLADALAGNTRNPARRAIARAAAEAEIDVRRVRQHRAAVLSTEIMMVTLEAAASNEDVDAPTIAARAMVRMVDRLQRMERYARRTMSKRDRIFRELAACPD